MSKYIDTAATMQVIGTVFNNPQLLDMADKYKITKHDFGDQFHRTVYGAMHAMYHGGINTFTLEGVADFLQEKPKSQLTYNNGKGAEYLTKVSDIAKLDSFDFYYQRLKKMSLLRAYDNIGVDVSFIYDADNFNDIQKKEAQEEYLDNATLTDITEKVRYEIEKIEWQYAADEMNDAKHVADSIDERIESYKTTPQWGIPLYGDIHTTIFKGARLGRLYCRSAATGTGKTRTLMADACMIGCDEMYDSKKQCWISTGPAHPTSVVVTEQDLEDVQDMMLACLSDIDEDRITDYSLTPEEEDRLAYAVQILKRSPVYIDELHTFSLNSLEATIKRSVREHQVQYVIFDYIQSKIEIFSEIASLVGKMPLREDQILLLQATKLKDICLKYGVFMYTATQLNGDHKDAKVYDQNLIRGSKAVADKIDIGSVLVKVQAADIEALQPILSTGVFPDPGIKHAVYKNRKGKYTDLIVWCEKSLGTCRVTPLFVTDYNYKVIEVPGTKVLVTGQLQTQEKKDEDDSPF